MSVIIKGMQMPKSCKTCDLLQDYDGCMYCPFGDCPVFGDIEYVPNHVASDICPLVELPDHHGDLVDVNEIRWDDHYDSDGNLSKYKIAYSDEMPDAIVEAE